MSNPLRDQLKKANLLSKKDAKRLAHEERVHRKQVGREGLEAERAERDTELGSARAAEREADRQRQAVLEAERKAAQERAACEAILANARPAVGGPIRWFFECADGRLPCIKLQPTERLELTAGHARIVRLTDGDAHVYGLLPTAQAERVGRAFPARVVG